MLYRIFGLIVNAIVGQFFYRFWVRGAETVKQGPVIIAANHPNLMLDPLVVNRVFQRDLWFLAKSTLFRGPVISAFLRWCRLVPVYRRQDAGGV